MTCIVGLIDEGTVYMGADSAGVGATDIQIRKDQKIFSNGDFIFGFTSSFRMGQLLKYKLSIPPIPAKADLYDYMVTYFIDAVRSCLKAGGYTRVVNKVEEGGFFLVGIKDRLFEIQTDFQVAEMITHYSAVGCGYDIAFGSLYSTAGEIGSPSERIKKALQAAAYHSNSVAPPFHIIDTKSLFTTVLED